MGYKYKPNKSVAKRFRVTGTGKLKRSKGFHSHLMSARDAKQRRGLHRDDVLHEGHARNMREMMGLKKLKPMKTVHDRKARDLADKKAGKSETGTGTVATSTSTKIIRTKKVYKTATPAKTNAAKARNKAAAAAKKAAGKTASTTATPTTAVKAAAPAATASKATAKKTAAK